MPVASSRQTRITCPLTRPVPTPSTAPMITAAIPSGAGWLTRNTPPRATLRISGSSRLCCVTGRWMIWRAKMKTTITRASNAVTITLLFIRTLLLYRRHLGGPTIHQYGSWRDIWQHKRKGRARPRFALIFQEGLPETFPSFQPPACIWSRITNDVLKSSVTGARVGLHPSKGGKRGWVFLHAPFVLPECAALDVQRHEQDGEGSADEKREWVENRRKRGSTLTLHDVQFPGAHNGLRSALHLELAVDGVDIPFHRTQREDKPVGNLLIGAARDNQAQHRQFAFAERLAERVHSRPRYSYSRVRHVLVMRSAQQCQEVFSIACGARLIAPSACAHLH